MTDSHFLVSSREGRVCLDGHRVKRVKTQLFDADYFASGSLVIPATLDNILAVSQVFMDLFINKKGITLNKSEGGYKNLDVVGKYQQIPSWFANDQDLLRLFRGWFRSDRNLTRGWCYLAAGTLHRFFYPEFDLYRSECEFGRSDIKMDYHWWLYNPRRGTIDLTEEQYRVMRIYDLRSEGKKRGVLGHSYGVKTRNMAVLVASELCGATVEFEKVRVTGYNS
jgi:hypothetical protein